MKLGISYNIFNGLELLPFSIENFRPHVDHINVVYQTTSNHGTKDDEIEDTLKKMLDEGKIDSLTHFEPNLKLAAKQNETRKRNVGLKECLKQGCDYFMSLDADEFYIHDEFEFAKNLIESEGYDASACQMQTYYKHPNCRLVPPETYYVTFIHKIDNRTTFKMGMNWPVIVDPSRKTPYKKLKIFKRNELQMHHMSYVRKDMDNKLNNASAKVNYRTKIEEIKREWENYEPGGRACMAGKKLRYYDTEVVDLDFGIEI